MEQALCQDAHRNRDTACETRPPERLNGPFEFLDPFFADYLVDHGHAELLELLDLVLFVVGQARRILVAELRLGRGAVGFIGSFVRHISQ